MALAFAAGHPHNGAWESAGAADRIEIQQTGDSIQSPKQGTTKHTTFECNTVGKTCKKGVGRFRSGITEQVGIDARRQSRHRETLVGLRGRQQSTWRSCTSRRRKIRRKSPPIRGIAPKPFRFIQLESIPVQPSNCSIQPRLAPYNQSFQHFNGIR